MTPPATTQHDAHCQTHWTSSRVCELGTKGCNKQHDPVIPAALAEYCEAVRQRRMRPLLAVSGQQSVFEVVVKEHVTTHKEKSSGTLKQQIKDIITRTVKETGNKVHAAKRLGISRMTVQAYTKGLAVLLLLSTILYPLSTNAQRGALAFMSASAAPVVTNRQTFLMWDNPPGASNRVEWGMMRNAWTNGFATIRTNRFLVTNGWHYCVKSLLAGVESVPALWPSNRVGELWLRGMGTNLVGGTNIVRLLKFTNQPPGQMQFWGVANITTGWE